MRLLDSEILQSKALVVDCNATSRSILVSQLREFGIGSVSQCGRISDARAQLENKQFDVVLCEQGFAGTDYSGQQLLDDLRRHQLLPLSTVFIMITGEASYAKVAEAAESALDSYLLKPHTAAALEERLGQARRRKKVLRDIFEAVDDCRFEDAAALCLKRFQLRDEYWLFAARIGAELLLHLNRHQEARELFDAVLKTQALPWARLGIGRAQLEGGELAKASRTLESLIAEQPTYVDAYDIMGRVLVEQGNLEEAMTIYRQAATLTPSSVGRLQKLGMLAFYTGERDEAAKVLDRAVTIGISSKMFDCQTLVLLAFTRFHGRDSKGLQRCSDNLAHALSKAPDSRRLIRFARVMRVLNLMLHKQVAEAIQAIRELAQESREPNFDIEAGCNMISLMSELTGGELKLDGVEDWIDTIALRHCTSKSITELLARTAGAHPPFAERIRACYHRISGVAEKSMVHTLSGDPASAVRELLDNGKSTLNAKLLDTARAVLQRHHERISNAGEVIQQIDEIKQRYASGVAKTPLGDSHGRKVGGITLRTAAKPVDANAGKVAVPAEPALA